jgi:hypothetical protein
MSDHVPQEVSTGHCPICDARDAFVQPMHEGDGYYVECVNCKVYRASRRAFRHLEYLRWRQEREGLVRLAGLAAALRRGQPGVVRLEYDTWESLIDLSQDGLDVAMS